MSMHVVKRGKAYILCTREDAHLFKSGDLGGNLISSTDFKGWKLDQRILLSLYNFIRPENLIACNQALKAVLLAERLSD